MENTYEFWVNPDIDMRTVKDSMQLDSDQVIATLKRGDFAVSLEVKGEVRVTFDGELYTKPSEFPQDLKDLIASDDFWDCNERVDVGNNNWFEAVYRSESYEESDVVDLEGDTVSQLFSDAMVYMEDVLYWEQKHKRSL